MGAIDVILSLQVINPSSVKEIILNVTHLPFLLDVLGQYLEVTAEGRTILRNFAAQGGLLLSVCSFDILRKSLVLMKTIRCKALNRVQ